MTRLAWVLAVLLVPLTASAQNVIDGPLPEPTATPMLEVPATVIEAPTSTRDELRAQLASQRAAHLAELRRYVEAGVFPINAVQPGALNVFMDPTGHLCAVANLIVSQIPRVSSFLAPCPRGAAAPSLTMLFPIGL